LQAKPVRPSNTCLAMAKTAAAFGGFCFSSFFFLFFFSFSNLAFYQVFAFL
jgi:hypothetical protein